MTARAKPKYRTTNWKDYNAALNARGSLLIWLDKDMIAASLYFGRRPRLPLALPCQDMSRSCQISNEPRVFNASLYVL